MMPTAETSDNSLLITAALAVVAFAVSAWVYTSAFDDQFRCEYLIVDGVDAPQFMCDGADLGSTGGLSGAVDSVADALGLGGDEPIVGDAIRVPGLARLIDGPLDVVRKIGVVAGMLLLAASSAMIDWIRRHLPQVNRLLRFDPEAWRHAALRGRAFLSIYLGLLVPVVILAVVI